MEYIVTLCVGMLLGMVTAEAMTSLGDYMGRRMASKETTKKSQGEKEK